MRTIGKMYINGMGIDQNVIIGNQGSFGAGYEPRSGPNGFPSFVLCDEQGNRVFIDLISTCNP